ncbi:hypothetical protein B0J14DRAFT_587882 [Halenospora varia]|nr:hypothetical protein B0J14DRAFT_587882 [Halenospora varia]
MSVSIRLNALSAVLQLQLCGFGRFSREAFPSGSQLRHRSLVPALLQTPVDVACAESPVKLSNRTSLGEWSDEDIIGLKCCNGIEEFISPSLRLLFRITTQILMNSHSHHGSRNRSHSCSHDCSHKVREEPHFHDLLLEWEHVRDGIIRAFSDLIRRMDKISRIRRTRMLLKVGRRFEEKIRARKERSC